MARRRVVKSKKSRDDHAMENNLKDSNIPDGMHQQTLRWHLTQGNGKLSNVTVNKGGKKESFQAVNVNGTHYNVNTGRKVIDYGNSSTKSEYKNSDATDIRYTTKKSTEKGRRDVGELEIDLRDDPKPRPSSPPSPPSPPPQPRAPSKPRLEVLSEPRPTFTSDVQTLKKYEYFFGIDELKFQQMNINENCCLVTRNIGLSPDCEYIKLRVNDSINEYSNIEYYILDGENEHPILPVNKSEVKNEKVFYLQPTRFNINKDEDFSVRDGDESVNVTANSFNTSKNERRVVSYTPTDINVIQKFKIPKDNVNQDGVKPLPYNIKIKVILRIYDKFETPPIVFSMHIQEYGGSSLWKDNI